MPRMYCSKASRRRPEPAATKVSSETLKPGSSCRVSFQASESKTAISSRISPRAVTGCAHAQVGHVHQLRLGHNAGAVGHVAAHDDRIGVQRLGQLERTGARGVKALRQPQMIQRVHAVGAAHGSKARRGQTAGQNLRRGLANPLQAGLAGAVVKGQHQQDAATVRRGGAGLRGAWARAQTATERTSARDNPSRAASRPSRPKRDEENVCTTG